MPRLSKPHEQARNRLRDLSESTLPVPVLATRIARTLETAIGWDGFRLFGLDPSTMLVNRLLAASENDAEARLEWLREAYLQMPATYAELPVLARGRRRGVAYQEKQDECWGYAPKDLAAVDPARHYRDFHENRSPVGGALLTIFRHGDRPVAAMQAYRRDAKRQFRPSDVELMHIVNPIVGSALASAVAREEAMTVSTTSNDPSGIVLLNPVGVIQFVTPAGEEWLDRLGRNDHGLPTAIWSSLAARRTAGSDESVVISLAWNGHPVGVEATAGGPDGLTAVVISAVAPPPRPDIPDSWGLTPKEREVVSHLVTGKTNAQIAEAMFVSEHTIEWHLGSIYDKVGATNRQEVVAAVFRQAFLPGIERDVLRPAS